MLVEGLMIVSARWRRRIELLLVLTLLSGGGAAAFGQPANVVERAFAGNVVAARPGMVARKAAIPTTSQSPPRESAPRRSPAPRRDCGRTIPIHRLYLAHAALLL
jgi:hypothetical protein